MRVEPTCLASLLACTVPKAQPAAWSCTLSLPQLQRDQAGVQQEAALLADLRARRLAEQEAMIGQLAQERAAAAAQQGGAEAAVDAARAAELAAAMLLADVQAKVGARAAQGLHAGVGARVCGFRVAHSPSRRRVPSPTLAPHLTVCLQASHAKQAVEAAQQRLQQLQERCAAEEERLGALQAAVVEQQQGFDAQVRSLLDMGQQVCSLPCWSGCLGHGAAGVFAAVLVWLHSALIEAAQACSRAPGAVLDIMGPGGCSSVA